VGGANITPRYLLAHFEWGSCGGEAESAIVESVSLLAAGIAFEILADIVVVLSSYQIRDTQSRIFRRRNEMLEMVLFDRMSRLGLSNSSLEKLRLVPCPMARGSG
jgi:hypothetical protein